MPDNPSITGSTTTLVPYGGGGGGVPVPPMPTQSVVTLTPEQEKNLPRINDHLKAAADIPPPPPAPKILPTDEGSAQRIMGHAGVDPEVVTTSRWEPPAPGGKGEPPPKPVEVQPNAALRQDYADALKSGAAAGPQDFAERHVGAAWKTAGEASQLPEDNTPEAQGEQAAHLTNTAKGIAAALPSKEDTIDHAIAFAVQAGVHPTPENVNVVKNNLLDHWAQTGEDTASTAARAQGDPDLQRQLIMPPPPPAPTPEVPWWAHDPESEAAAAASKAVQPAIKEYIGSLKGPTAYDSKKSFAENVKNPEAVNDAMGMVAPGGLGIIESKIGIGGVELGREFTYQGKVVGQVLDKTLHIDPEAPVGEALSGVPVDKPGEPTADLHDAAKAEAKLSPAQARAQAAEPKKPAVEGEIEKPDPAQVKELAEGYRAAAGAARFADQLGAIWRDESGAFKWPFKGRTPDDRDFAEASIVRATGLGTQTIAQFAHDLEPMRKIVNPHMKEWEQEIAKGPAGAPMDTMIGNLIRYMQGRSTNVTLRADSPFGRLADMIRDINQTMEATLRQYHADGKITLDSYYQDYFRQLWKDPAAADKVFTGVGRQGTSASFKQRKFPTWDDGLAAGLEPAILNPIDLTLYDVAGKIRYLKTVDILKEGEDAGHVYHAFSPRGADVKLDGILTQKAVAMQPTAALRKAEADARRALDIGNQMGVKANSPAGIQLRANVAAATEAAKPTGAIQYAYASPGYARSYNNAISNGMQSHPVGAAAYDGLMYMKNTLTSFNLINPLFHIRTVGLGSYAGGVAQDMEELARRQFQRFLGTMIGLPIRPISDFYIGAKAYRDYLDRTMSNPDVQKLIEAGLTVGKRQHSYQMGAAPNLFRSIINRSFHLELAEDLKAIPPRPSATAAGAAYEAARTFDRTLQFGVKEAGRVMTAITGPTFDTLIPHVKLGAAIRRLNSYLDANKTASEAAVSLRTRQIVKDVENRMGEGNFDAIFVPKMVKQIANIAQISSSWKLLSYRGFLAAATITTRGIEWNPSATTSLIGGIVTYMTFNSIEQYAHDGTLPWQTDTPLHDLLNFRTGGTPNPSGTPRRGMLPTEFKEIYDLGRIISFAVGSPIGATQATAEYALGALNVFWRIVRGYASGENWQGLHIAQMPGGYTAWLKEQLEPFFASQEEQRKAGSGIGALETFLGDKEAAGWSQDWANAQRALTGIRAKWTKDAARKAARENAAKGNTSTGRGYSMPARGSETGTMPGRGYSIGTR